MNAPVRLRLLLFAAVLLGAVALSGCTQGPAGGATDGPAATPSPPASSTAPAVSPSPSSSGGKYDY